MTTSSRLAADREAVIAYLLAAVPGLDVFARATLVTLLLASGAMFALTRLEKRLIFHL